ncbi:unnamed protein product [Caretta caretta]
MLLSSGGLRYKNEHSRCSIGKQKSGTAGDSAAVLSFCGIAKKRSSNSSCSPPRLRSLGAIFAYMLYPNKKIEAKIPSPSVQQKARGLEADPREQILLSKVTGIVLALL